MSAQDAESVAVSIRAIQVGWWRFDDKRFVSTSYGDVASTEGFERVYILRTAKIDGRESPNGD